MAVAESLLEIAERIARTRYDGHLTVMRFTTHWKIMFGTPNLDIDGRVEVRRLKGFPTLEQALKQLILEELSR
jgi:hypothetical protein